MGGLPKFRGKQSRGAERAVGKRSRSRVRIPPLLAEFLFAMELQAARCAGLAVR